MSRLDHERRNRQAVAAVLRTEDTLNEGRRQEAAIFEANQARYGRFARENAQVNRFCRKIPDQVRSGHRITSKQAAVLDEIAVEMGTKIPTVGSLGGIGVTCDRGDR
jgi:hypothetical protein